MRSQNRKVKVTKSGSALVGRAGCLGLLALGLALVNPIASVVYAYDGAPDGGGGSESGSSGSSSLASSVQISFGEPVGVSSLTPIDADGASALYSVRATVDVTNSGGYTVYLGSSKAELTGKNSGATINGVTSSTSYEGMPVNSWGYSYNEGEDAGTTFSAMPANIRGVTLGGNNSTNIKTDSKTFTLSFAAHIGNDKPADTYENEVTMSVVSSPLEIVKLEDITNMQEMTAEICTNSAVGDTKQLVDLRDNKSYWVAKLADNKCWMTQNLALNLSTSWPDASLSDYDVAVTTYKPVATASSLVAAAVNSSATGTRSYSQGLYVLVNPSVNSDCGVGNANAAACTEQFISVGSRKVSSDPDFYTKNGKKTYNASEYDAHYLVGNHYQWNAATAGTGGTITSGQASGSICPKGWRLPSSESDTMGDFAGLLSAGKISGDVDKLVGSPYFFVRGGYAYQDTNLYARGGRAGSYWSSTPVNNSAEAYSFDFDSQNGVTAAGSNQRRDGFSVRCIAR